MQHSSVQHSSVQHSSVQHSSVQHSSVHTARQDEDENVRQEVGHDRLYGKGNGRKRADTRVCGNDKGYGGNGETGA